MQWWYEQKDEWNKQSSEFLKKYSSWQVWRGVSSWPRDSSETFQNLTANSLSIALKVLFAKYLSHLLYKLSRERAVGKPSAIEGQAAKMNSLGRDKTPRQTCHELYFFTSICQIYCASEFPFFYRPFIAQVSKTRKHSHCVSSEIYKRERLGKPKNDVENSLRLMFIPYFSFSKSSFYNKIGTQKMFSIFSKWKQNIQWYLLIERDHLF